MNITEALERYFGYKSFRPGQKDIIESILRGESVVAVLPTGAGKSICYQIPAVVSDTFSIVVSPLIALMKDQVDSLNKKEEFAAFINSTMSFAEADKVLQKISFGQIKILYVSPERLELLSFAEKIKKLQPSHIFIDEAHCISEWGHNFRPSYTKIKDFISFTGINKIAAFTATATPEVINDIIVQLGIKKHKLFIRGFERENLSLNVIPTKNKKSETLRLLRSNHGPAIIYTSSRKQAEEISGFLNLCKTSCEYYHAGVNPIVRRKIQDDFISGSLDVIAATNAFGMGIDKKDIRTVIHYNIPGSIENYYQEIGRAGRDGKPSAAFLLFDEKDIEIQNYFIENSHPDKSFIQQVYQLICDYGKVPEGSLPETELSINSGFLSAVMQKEISKSMLNSALRLLESGGYLKVLSEFDKKSSVQILLDKNRLKNLVKRSLNPLLKDILVLLVREFGNEIFSKKIKINFNSLSEKLSLPADEIDESLEQLNNMGIILYQKITGKENVMLTKPRVSSTKLYLDFKKINENYLRSRNKLQQMVDFVFTSQCRFGYILNYFGEDTSVYKCSRCDRCITVESVPEASRSYIKELLLRSLYSVKELVNENTLLKILLGTARSETLQKIETFGSGSNINRNEIKSALSELIMQKLIERNKINIKYLQLGSKGREYLNNNKITDPGSAVDYNEDLELFNLLREARTKAAKKFVQPGYIICPDDLLRAVSQARPRDKDSLLKIKGFNERMFVKTGHDFLEIINNFLSEKSHTKENKTVPSEKSVLPKNIKETYNLLLRKYSLKDIAALQKLSEAVISMQVETILEYFPHTDISCLTGKEIINNIMDKIKEGKTELKALKDSLPPDYSYSIIRIVLAKVNTLMKSPFSTLQYEL